jgi:Glycosyltransferase 61
MRTNTTVNTTAARNRVKIILEETAPPTTSVPVDVHYIEAGIQKTMTARMRLPIYFDGIAVSIVHELLPGVAMPQITPSSVRDVARFGYHTARVLEAKIRRPRIMREPVFDTRGWEPNNFAHLLLDLIPYSLYVRRAVGPEVVILFRKLGKRFGELLDIFGLVPDFERRRVEADVVKICGTRGLAVYDLDLRTTFDCPGICFVPNVYAEMDFSSSTKYEKVFLARRDARRLVNQTEVEETVARFGYHTVFMEDYSLHEQLSIGAQAKHVVAIHGAAMSFLVMGRRIDSIIELLPTNNYAAGFPVALGLRVRHYEQIIPSFDRTVQHIGWPAIVSFKNLPFAVDTSLLANRLTNIH